LEEKAKRDTVLPGSMRRAESTILSIKSGSEIRPLDYLSNGLRRVVLRSRYEITYTSLSISLRLLMPFRNVSAQLIL
jgi:hypothetical protein